MPTSEPELPPQLLQWLREQPVSVLRQVSRELGRLGEEQVGSTPGQLYRAATVQRQLDVLNPTAGLRVAEVAAAVGDRPHFPVHEDWVTTRLMLDGWSSIAGLQAQRPDHLTPQGVLDAVLRLVQVGTVVVRNRGGVEQFLVPQMGTFVVSTTPTAALIEREGMLYPVSEPDEPDESDGLTALDHVLAD